MDPNPTLQNQTFHRKTQTKLLKLYTTKTKPSITKKTQLFKPTSQKPNLQAQNPNQTAQTLHHKNQTFHHKTHTKLLKPVSHTPNTELTFKTNIPTLLKYD